MSTWQYAPAVHGTGPPLGHVWQVEAETQDLPKVHMLLSAVPDGTLGWSGGVEEGTYEQFKSYVQAIRQFGVSARRLLLHAPLGQGPGPTVQAGLQVPSFDVVLVDGRRVRSQDVSKRAQPVGLS